jgi:hypothetical protein
MGIRFFRRGAGKLPVYLWQIRFLKKPAGSGYGKNPGKPHFFHQPVLAKPAVPFHPAFCRGAVRRYYLHSQFPAGSPKTAFRFRCPGQQFHVSTNAFFLSQYSASGIP